MKSFEEVATMPSWAVRLQSYFLLEELKVANKKSGSQVGKVAQRVKVLASLSDYLSLVAGTLQLLQFVL